MSIKGDVRLRQLRCKNAVEKKVKHVTGAMNAKVVLPLNCIAVRDKEDGI